MKCWARNLMACGAASLLLWGLLFIWFFICEMVNLQTYGCFSCCIFPFWTHGLSPVPKSRRDCLLSHLGLCLIEESVVWGPWTTVQILGMCLLSVDEFMNQRMSHFHFPFRHYYSWLPDITLPTLPNFLLYPILFIASMFVCYSCLLFAVWNLLSTFFLTQMISIFKDLAEDPCLPSSYSLCTFLNSVWFWLSEFRTIEMPTSLHDFALDGGSLGIFPLCASHFYVRSQCLEEQGHPLGLGHMRCA